MALFPDTTELDIPEYTIQEFPRVRHELATAVASLDKAVKIAFESEDPSMKRLAQRLLEARDKSNAILESLMHRF